MKLYFVRHGESEANVLRVISNRWVHPLTEKGRQQAHDLADKLRDADIIKIYTSPVSSAVADRGDPGPDPGGRVSKSPDALREFDCGIADGHADAEAWKLHAWVTA